MVEVGEIIEIKPCPFCGSPAAIENLSKPQHERHITAGCSNENCFAYLPSVYFAREADAIAAWNRRAPDPERDELREALRPFAEFAEKKQLPGHLPWEWLLTPEAPVMQKALRAAALAGKGVVKP